MFLEFLTNIGLDTLLINLQYPELVIFLLFFITLMILFYFIFTLAEIVSSK